MVLIHKKTFEIYTRIVGEDYDKNDYFECDELMAPIIYNLNKKGYKTKFCCTGHIYPEKQTTADGSTVFIYDNFYISFEENYDFDFESFPENAWMDDKTLRIDIITWTDIVEERRDIILKACNDVWKWTVDLLNAEEFEKKKKKEKLRDEVNNFFDYCIREEIKLNIEKDVDNAMNMYLHDELILNTGMRLIEAVKITDEIKEYIKNLKGGF